MRKLIYNIRVLFYSWRIRRNQKRLDEMRRILFD